MIKAEAYCIDISPASALCRLICWLTRAVRDLENACSPTQDNRTSSRGGVSASEARQPRDGRAGLRRGQPYNLVQIGPLPRLLTKLCGLATTAKAEILYRCLTCLETIIESYRRYALPVE